MFILEKQTLIHYVLLSSDTRSALLEWWGYTSHMLTFGPPNLLMWPMWHFSDFLSRWGGGRNSPCALSSSGRGQARRRGSAFCCCSYCCSWGNRCCCSCRCCWCRTRYVKWQHRLRQLKKRISVWKKESVLRKLDHFLWENKLIAYMHNPVQMLCLVSVYKGQCLCLRCDYVACVTCHIVYFLYSVAVLCYCIWCICEGVSLICTVSGASGDP